MKADIHKSVKLIKPTIFSDERGFFLETYHQDRYKTFGIDDVFVQDNHSYSRKNTLRGMHYQSVPGQVKLVWALTGEIFDVVVDIRPNSPDFGTWQAFRLSAKEATQLYIPIGFAHGFCVLSEEAHVVYKVSSFYDPKTEKGFRWDDPTIGIQWPITHPILSERDLKNPFLHELSV